MKKKFLGILLALVLALSLSLVMTVPVLAWDNEDPCIASNEDFIMGGGWNSTGEFKSGAQPWALGKNIPNEGYNLYRDDVTNTGNFDSVFILTYTPDEIDLPIIAEYWSEATGTYWYMGDESKDTWYWAKEPRGYDNPEPPAPVRSPNAFDVFVRFGYDSTRYYSNDALASSIEAAGEYNDTRYMLKIPEGCIVTGTPGRINWLWLDSITDGVLTFAIEGNATFSEPCTLYITDGGRLYKDYWTGDWLGGGEWVEVGSFTAIVDGEAHLD